MLPVKRAELQNTIYEALMSCMPGEQPKALEASRVVMAALYPLTQPQPEVFQKAPDAPWPAGCPKQNSCSRNRACMYGCSAHTTRNGPRLRQEIEAATQAAHVANTQAPGR